MKLISKLTNLPGWAKLLLLAGILYFGYKLLSRPVEIGNSNTGGMIVGATQGQETIKYGDYVNFFVSDKGGISGYLHSDKASWGQGRSDDVLKNTNNLVQAVIPSQNRFKFQILDRFGEASGQEWKFGDSIILKVEVTSGVYKFLSDERCIEDKGWTTKCEKNSNLRFIETCQANQTPRCIWKFISPLMEGGQMLRTPVTYDSYGQLVNVSQKKVISSMREKGNLLTDPVDLMDARSATFFQVKKLGGFLNAADMNYPKSKAWGRADYDSQMQ